MIQTQREKSGSFSSPVAFAPIGQALIESFSEGVVVFDGYGRVLYANQRARRLIEGLSDAVFQRGDGLRERLIALGGRARALKHGGTDLGEAIFLSDGERPKTLAERERQAIVETLELTHGRLAETARRLGISRTTLWRRLRAYGLRPDGQDESPSRA